MIGSSPSVQQRPYRATAPVPYGGPTIPSVSFLPSGSPAPQWSPEGIDTVYGFPSARFFPYATQRGMKRSPPASRPSE